MLALCLMLLLTYYAQNYAGIIGASLIIGELFATIKLALHTTHLLQVSKPVPFSNDKCHRHYTTTVH